MFDLRKSWKPSQTQCTVWTRISKQPFWVQEKCPFGTSRPYAPLQLMGPLQDSMYNMDTNFEMTLAGVQGERHTAVGQNPTKPPINLKMGGNQMDVHPPQYGATWLWVKINGTILG